MLVCTICRSVWLLTVAGGAKPRPPPPPPGPAAGAAGAGGVAGAGIVVPLGGTTIAGATGGPPGPPARGPGSGRDTRAVVHVVTHLSLFDWASAAPASASASRAVDKPVN